MHKYTTVEYMQWNPINITKIVFLQNDCLIEYEFSFVSDRMWAKVSPTFVGNQLVLSFRSSKSPTSFRLSVADFHKPT